ncbi:MAG: RHS repeat-associated core domain-containing protein [Ktedonobacteraceae bacterium]|nr:RHS repeat-associated core domain-containing protein [Ktedonobacteraceae bacterium]
MAGTATYDAYGRVLTQTGTLTPFGYAGEYTDAASGLQYLRARSYDPATQQFLTVDPLLAATEQAYAYAGGSPTNATDPSGNESDGICINVGASGVELMPNSGSSVGHNHSLCFTISYGPHDPADVALQWSPGVTVGTASRGYWATVVGLRSIQAQRSHDLDGGFIGGGASATLKNRIAVGGRPLPNTAQVDIQGSFNPDGSFVDQTTCGVGFSGSFAYAPLVEAHIDASTTVTLLSSRDFGDGVINFMEQQVTRFTQPFHNPLMWPGR